MGIRVKKILGYGLDDLQTDDNGDIIDERINPVWVDRIMDERTSKSIEGYFEFARGRKAGAARMFGDVHLYKDISFNCTPHLREFLTWDSEFGLPEVAVLTPITGMEWKRYDDMIDYYDERPKGYWGCEPHVEILDTPLYPYDNYINNETGERAENDVREWIYMFRNADIDLKRTDLTEERVASLCTMRATGLDRLQCDFHWTERWNVAIPEQLQDYCLYMEMFNDERSMWKLLPMIYTYWS